MLTKQKKEGFAQAKPSKELEWNKIATIIATIVVLLFFTRSAPFPSSTYWELTIARDFIDSSSPLILFPETIALAISNSSISLIGLKAIYHIIYFILCSAFCLWIFKTKEPLPGLVGLSIFSFTMQSFLNLRMLLTLTLLIILLLLLDKKIIQNKFGLILIPIFAAASGLGLNTNILISLVLCYILCNPNFKISLILCSLLGGLIFTDGFVASLNYDSIVNWSFMPKTEMEILYVLSGIFLLINIVSIVRISSSDLPIVIFYAITGFFALMQPNTISIFVTMGLFVFIKLYSDQKPLSLNFQMLGLLIITAMVYLYLFINPFGIKLNPNIRSQLTPELSTLMDGYTDNIQIDKYNLGELAWKNIIRYEPSKIRSIFQNSKELLLVRRGADDYILKQRPQNNNQPKHKEIEF